MQCIQILKFLIAIVYVYAIKLSFSSQCVVCEYLLTYLFQIHDPRFPQTETRKSRSHVSTVAMEESESSSESEDEEDETQGLSLANY